MTSSLDQHLKIYEYEGIPKLVHQLKYPAGIMSFDVSLDLSHLAVGTNEGLVSIKTKTAKVNREDGEEINEEYKYPKIENTEKIVKRDYKFFNRGIYETPESFDVIYSGEKKIKLQEFDRYLKKFQYKNALKAALETTNGDSIYTLIEELIQRNALLLSCDTKDEEEIVNIFDYLIANISNPKYSKVLVQLADKLIDNYTVLLYKNEKVKESFVRFNEKIEQDLNDQKDMLNILGKIELLLDCNSF